MKETKYSKIPEKTPQKGSIFDSSASSSAASSRPNSPPVVIPKKPIQKKKSCCSKFVLFLLIVLTLLFSLYFARFVNHLSVWVNGCDDSQEPYNLFCVPKNKFEAIKEFCEAVQNKENVNDNDLQPEEKEMIKYCPMIKVGENYLGMISNKAHIFLIVICLFFTILGTTLFMLHY